MNIIEVILIGIGLSMDATAVTITNSMVYKGLPKRRLMLMPLFFGVFQGLMPMLGFYTGNLFYEVISKYSGIVTFIILGIIGGKMIWDNVFGKDDDEITSSPELTVKVLTLQAIATSIDAFAVGVSFCATNSPIFSSSTLIALTTFICVIFAVVLGKKLGHLLESKAEIVGGLVLIAIGVKALF
ncbi:MAG: manganese efflux pump [Firmicutes bacterium]|nr:manganese efflux pump [Bacillota bacterium]